MWIEDENFLFLSHNMKTHNVKMLDYVERKLMVFLAARWADFLYT